MSPVTREAYEEFRDYLATQPDSVFLPKEGDENPSRRAKPEAKPCSASNASADRARNHAVFACRKVAQIKDARQKGKSMKAAFAT